MFAQKRGGALLSNKRDIDIFCIRDVEAVLVAKLNEEWGGGGLVAVYSMFLNFILKRLICVLENSGGTEEPLGAVGDERVVTLPCD